LLSSSVCFLCVQGKVAMDVIQDAYGIALMVGALLLWFGFASMLPVLYIALYACYNLFHPIRLSTISDLAGKVRSPSSNFA
jgi:hypothetical protein